MTILDRIIAQKEIEVKDLKAIYTFQSAKPMKRGLHYITASKGLKR